MTEKRYDLAERTEKFCFDCRKLIRGTKKDIANIEDCKQLARSSGSVAANYLEADEAISKKDFVLRIKICRKEARESQLWLKTIVTEGNSEKARLIDEARQLVKIFNAIVGKTS